MKSLLKKIIPVILLLLNFSTSYGNARGDSDSQSTEIIGTINFKNSIELDSIEPSYVKADRHSSGNIVSHFNISKTSPEPIGIMLKNTNHKMVNDRKVASNCSGAYIGIINKTTGKMDTFFISAAHCVGRINQHATFNFKIAAEEFSLFERAVTQSDGSISYNQKINFSRLEMRPWYYYDIVTVKMLPGHKISSNMPVYEIASTPLKRGQKLNYIGYPSSIGPVKEYCTFLGYTMSTIPAGPLIDGNGNKILYKGEKFRLAGRMNCSHQNRSVGGASGAPVLDENNNYVGTVSTTQSNSEISTTQSNSEMLFSPVRSENIITTKDGKTDLQFNSIKEEVITEGIDALTDKESIWAFRYDTRGLIEKVALFSTDKERLWQLDLVDGGLEGAMYEPYKNAADIYTKGYTTALELLRIDSSGH